MIFVTRIYTCLPHTHIIIIIMTRERKEPPKNHCHWFTIILSIIRRMINNIISTCFILDPRERRRKRHDGAQRFTL